MNHQKIYNQIIERAQTRKLDTYVEKHHIMPKCIGGLDIKENIVELTAREHFLCHRLLCEIYPKEHKLLYALWLMAIGKKRSKDIDPYKITGREYERLKINFINKRTLIKITQSHKDKVAKSNSIPVYQYDIQGNLIRKWDSAMDAQRHFTNKNHWKDLPDNISSAARGAQKTSHGYIWSYQDTKIDPSKHIFNQTTKKPIICIDINGNTSEFSSKSEAKKTLNFSEHAFSKLINGEKAIGKKGKEYNYTLQWK
jgi:hypothetical protein